MDFFRNLYNSKTWKLDTVQKVFLSLARAVKDEEKPISKKLRNSTEKK